MPSTIQPESSPPAPRKRKTKSRAKHPKFERLDIALEQQIGHDETMAELGPITDDVERFRVASRIATDLAAELKPLRDERHNLAVGLYAYRGVRAVHEAAGMWRDVMRRVTLRTLRVERLPTMADRVAAVAPDAPEAKKTNVVDPEAMKALAQAARVPKPPRDIDQALRDLVDVGRKVLRKEGARKAAVTVRDALAVQLSDDGAMTWDEVSSIMGAYRRNRWTFARSLRGKEQQPDT